jgi:hypothetical protein
MKIIIIKSIRWIFGIFFCLGALSNLSDGNKIAAFISLIIGLLLLPPIAKVIFKKKNNDAEIIKINHPQSKFESKISQIQLPKIELINWHIKAIETGFVNGDLNQINLSYAKLIESVRQENLKKGNNYETELRLIIEEYDNFRQLYGVVYPSQFLPASKKISTINAQNINIDVVINPNSNFSITLYNAPADIIQKIKNIFLDEKIWNKDKELLPMFIEHNIRCREIDEYINKYKPAYETMIEALKNNSNEYQTASEMDRSDIERDFFIQAENSLYEKAACNIDLLFNSTEISSIDIELIKDYGFENISRYISLSSNFDKVHVDFERKDFEDLIRNNLAIPSEKIPIDEILKEQTLKTLNKIANKEETFFKRKEKAIEFIHLDSALKNNIGNYVSMRRIFKLSPLPEKYKSINLNELSSYFLSSKEQIKLIISTYRDSQINTENIMGDLSWVKGFSVEKQEDYNPEFICLRAREMCKKKFSKTNRPKLPFHIGCNCYLKTDT